MANLTMHCYLGSSHAAKGLIAAQYGGVDVQLTPDFQMGTDNKTKEFLAMNPNGKVPTLETPDGAIFESNAIAKYIASIGNEAGQALLGGNAYEQALVQAWMDWAQTELALPRAAWLFPIMGYIPYSKAGEKQAKGDVRKYLVLLSKHLADKTYLVGERITLADIVVFCTVKDLYTNVLDTNFRKAFGNANRWFMTIANQPEVAAVVGEIAMADKMARVDPAVIAEQEAARASTSDNNNGGGKKKKNKGGNNNAAAAPAKKKKKKDPLAELPPSSMDLNDFKKLYSNNDTRSVVIPQFWDMYDADGYSCWFVEYKYASDLKLSFMASNLVGGWFQRLPRLHKYAFASILILKSEADDTLAIKGFWMVRGQELPADLQESDDSEHYTWTKADTTNEADRTLIENYMAWDGIEGWSCEDGKNFK